MSTVLAMPPAGPAPLVLVADDNRDTREIYALHLRMVGYRVETAENGRDATAKARARLPDAIVMDLSMPDVDGWAAMGELQADPRTAGIPVVVLTGHDLRDYLKRAAIAVGARSFLTKPCPPERLEREVAAQINAQLDAAAQARRAAPAE